MPPRMMICKHCGAEVKFEETSAHTMTHKGTRA